MYGLFPVERFDDIRSRRTDFRLLERVPFTKEQIFNNLPIILCKKLDNEKVLPVVILDGNISGNDFNKDRLIELALLKLEYSLDRNIFLSVDKYYWDFEDPKFSLSINSQKRLQITNDMLLSKKFNDDLVVQFCTSKSLIVSHNAKILRPFFDKRFSLLKELSWASSYININWAFFNDNIAVLESLLYKRGFFYDAKRSITDCFALAWLLYIEPNAFAMLLDSVRDETYHIEAIIPYRLKDEIKNLGYKFNAIRKTWNLYVKNENEVNNAIGFLATLSNQIQYRITKLSAKSRFKLK